MSLRPPSTSPSPSPGPHADGKASARQSMGPSRVTPTLQPASPRPGGQQSARPTSELLGAGTMFQTPEAEALDQWFEQFQSYEATLEDMAAASLDVNFKEELSAIEQWFKVLSEAERTAALYSLLQHSTQVQIRFFITVLQQMARSDPMTALLSPAMGSMQSQMESKLASLKSPGLKSGLSSGLPASPTTRSFNTNNRQSLALDNPPNPFLSPDSANSANQNDAAAQTLAQQRAKLKATHASNRISAPVLATAAGDARSWGAAASSLGQVSESLPSPRPQEVSVSRPKSTEFSGNPIGTPRNEATTTISDSWANMVNTPLIPMFEKAPPRPAQPVKESTKEWQAAPVPGVPRMGDPTVYKRKPQHNNHSDDDHGNNARSRNVSGNGSGGNWNRGQGPNNNGPSNRFGGDDNHSNGQPNGLGMQMPNLNQMGQMGVLGSPTMGMVPGLGMQPMSPFNMNMLGMMNMTPEAQLLAAQMAASGFGQPWMGGMQPLSAGLGQMNLNNQNRRGPGSARSPGLKSASTTGGGNSTPKGEEDVDPALLNDIPGWLRSLRLHKYTPNFEGANWRDMVMMDEAALEVKGVAALGARRKMLKTFELVRKKMGIDGGPPSAAPSSAVPSSAGV